MRKCVLFDFDGVLVDSEWRLFCQIREWLTKEYRITMPDSDCMRYIGGNDEATARDLIARYALPVGVEALAGQISAHSTLYEDGTLTLLPGAREFLVSLRRQGVRTGLVSSTESRHILAAANHLGLTGLFEVMICGDMVARHKPDPEGYRCLAPRRATALFWRIRPPACGRPRRPVRILSAFAGRGSGRMFRTPMPVWSITRRLCSPRCAARSVCRRQNDPKIHVQTPHAVVQ